MSRRPERPPVGPSAIGTRQPMLTRPLRPEPTEPAIVGGPDRERWPAELQLLLGPEAAGILRTVADDAGAALGPWSARTVSHQPGGATLVRYDVELQWPDRPATGETVVAATGARIPAGADVLDHGTTRVGVWRWPADPALPGLARATDPASVGALLADLGIDGGAVRLQLRAYRPGRRAVIEATGRRGRQFLKVVRPKAVEALHDTHRELAVHLPVPESLGWTDDGVVVLGAVPGATLRQVLRSTRRDAPHPAEIEALLDRLPASLAARPARAGQLTDAARHASTIASVLPASAALLAELGERLAAAADRPAADHPVVAVHGDLYEAQLLVAGGRFSGLLDVDTAGAGARADDWANLLAHLSVLALAARPAGAIRRYGHAVQAHVEATLDPADLRARVAAAVVGLATGPFRVLERTWPANTVRRLELAREWLDEADRRPGSV